MHDNFISTVQYLADKSESVPYNSYAIGPINDVMFVIGNNILELISDKSYITLELIVSPGGWWQCVGECCSSVS